MNDSCVNWCFVTPSQRNVLYNKGLQVIGILSVITRKLKNEKYKYKKEIKKKPHRCRRTFDTKKEICMTDDRWPN